ncbi:hypothetical protein RFI_37211, partial [Reticulomyxa filosa]
ILKDNDIQIVYSMAKVEPVDKSKSRPKSHSNAKYVSIADWQVMKRHKNDPSKHKCVLCRKQHPSDSLQCDVIRKAREKLGIKLTRKEDAFLKKKASQPIPIKSNVQQQPKNYSYTDAAKGSNGNEIKNGPQKPKKRTSRKKDKRQNNKNQILQNKKSDADEISLLRRELAEMKSAFQQLQSLLHSINPTLMQMGIGNRSRDEINVANTNMQADL